jgi:hypothetical protein
MPDCAPNDAEHFGSTDSSISEKPWNGSASRFTDAQYKMASAACDSGDKSIKQRCFLPHHEPGGATSRAGVHSAAGYVSSLKGHDASAVATAKAHLRSHYKQLGEDPPDSISAAVQGQQPQLTTRGGLASDGVTQPEPHTHPLSDMLFAHQSMSGEHSHPHSAYGQQGGDETHDHPHVHADDRSHAHDHSMARPAPAPKKITAGAWPLGAYHFQTDAPPAGSAIVAMAGPIRGLGKMRGAKWGIEQDEHGFHLLVASGERFAPPNALTAAGVPWTTDVGANTYGEALEQLAIQLAADTDTRPVLAATWSSQMAFENVDTGDGRFIQTGAIEYRDTPLPLMLQTETAPAHMTALLAGAITATGKLGTIAIGSGDFDDSPVGQQFTDIIAARGKFGVSIDVAEADGDFECTETDPATQECTDGRMSFSLIRVMGLTGTPFPAFEDAYIEMASANAATTSTSPVAAAAVPIVLPADPEHAARAVAALAATGASTLAVPGPVHEGVSASSQSPEPCEECDEAARAAQRHITLNDYLRSASGPMDLIPRSAVRPVSDNMVDGIEHAVQTYGQGGSLPPGVVVAEVQRRQDGSLLAGPITASVSAATVVAPPVAPPGEWFADPHFAPGDGRMVEQIGADGQPAGYWACPLTVDPPDPATGLRRVYGHVASWSSCHTGVPGRCVPPPHSRSGYAAFNRRPVPTAEGDLVRIGFLSMGCGHAATDVPLSADEVTAHYDGGPGAIRMATVHAGEDAYGPWFAGYLNPEATPSQVAAFTACSVSGDWREVWTGKGLDLLACLAGVTVPGFVITASAGPLEGITELTASAVAWDQDRPIALVACGIVRQPQPWERDIARLTGIINRQNDRIEALAAAAAPLRPLATQALQASAGLTPPSTEDQVLALQAAAGLNGNA